MSSRSFRRRSNRRRHRPRGGRADDAQGQQAARAQPGGSVAPAARRSRQQGAPGVRAAAARHSAVTSRQQGHAGAGRRTGRSAGRRGKGVPEPRPRPETCPSVFPDCPVCGKQVRELASALTHRVSRVARAFRLRRARAAGHQRDEPRRRSSATWAAARFGILEFRPPGGPSRFVIKKRIQYEEKETPQDWKKPLQITC